MKYWVQPKVYHRGYCPTVCNSEKSAMVQLEFMENHTDFEWEIIVRP